MAANMETGASTIVDPNTGYEYHLTQEQIDNFNQAYDQALYESTQEYLTNLVLQDNILQQQVIFSESKDEAIEAAQSIATVTAIAEEIEGAEESRKIQLESYATENGLRDIKDGDVQKFNASIEGMVESSRTKNMLEQYNQEIIEGTTFITQATNTVQAFYDNVDFVASSINNSMNVDWGIQSIQVDTDFFQHNDMGFYNEVTLR